MSTLEERRNRARQTFDAMLHDRASDDEPVFELSDCVTGAIETATRVRITPEIIRAAYPRLGPGNRQHMRPVIEAAFRAAGFEVER